MSKEFGLHFGALADSLKDQLAEQGLTLPNEQLFEKYDKLMFSYNMLRIHSMLTSAEADKVAKRILKNIQGDVVALEIEQ